MFSKSNPETAFYIMNAIMRLADTIMFTVMTVYYFTMVGLDPLELVLVGTLLEGTILLLEVPTGVVADTFSRRLSVVIGIFVLGTGFVIVGALPFFAFVLLGQIVTGVGYTFLSGATEGWLASEVGEQEVGRIYIRSGQIERIVSLFGTGISVALASLSLQLPILVGGGLYLLLGFYLAFFMPERAFRSQEPERSSNWHAMFETFRNGTRVVRQSPLLLTLLFVGVFSGAASEGFDRLADAHLLDNFAFPSIGSLQPVVWFGIINIVGSLFTIAVTGIFRTRMEAATHNPAKTAWILFGLNSFLVVAGFIFALSGSFSIAVTSLIAYSASRALSYPLFNAWLVQHVDARVRSTVFSMIGQTDALGQIAGGPGVGWAGRRYSLRSALVLSSILLIPAGMLYASVTRRPPPVSEVEVTAG